MISQREKGRDLTQSYEKSPYTHKTIQKSNAKTQKRHQNFDYTTIADQLTTKIQWEYLMHQILQTDKILHYLLKVYIILYLSFYI